MGTTLVIPRHVADRLNARTETCENCRWRHKAKDGDIECRRRAPQVSILLVPVQEPVVRAQPMQSLKPRPFSCFPLVQDDHFCGEWEAKPEAVQ